MKRDYGVFQVGLKILLRKGSKILFLRMADGKYLDIPGGRIDNVEYRVPLEKIIAREIREELGPRVRYALASRSFVSAGSDTIKTRMQSLCFWSCMMQCGKRGI